MWKETTQHERNLRIWETELDSFLPPSILDFHVHVFNQGVAPDDSPFRSGGHPIAKYDLDDLRHDLDVTYPGRETSAVCFGFPDLDYDQRRNDEYLSQNCDRQRFFPLRLLDPQKDRPEVLKADLLSGRFLGIKPYPVYVRKEDPSLVEIPEMLPEWAMKAADEAGSIVMLHIPRKQRLADPVNQRQIVELCERFPDSKIVLAHIGRAYYLQNIVGHLDRLKDLPNLWYDLAMLNHWEVLEYLFATVDPGKILYGTDIPIALAPGKSVEINNQYAYVTPVPWELSISDDHGQLAFTSFLYEELRAIKKAVEKLELGQRFVNCLFFENGAQLLEAAGESAGLLR